MQSFLDVADKLRNWEMVGFEWRENDESRTLHQTGRDVVICVERVPTIEQARDAVIAAQAAKEKTQTRKNALTAAEREVLR